MNITVVLPDDLALILEASGLVEEEIAEQLVALANSHMRGRANKIIMANRPAATTEELTAIKEKILTDKAAAKAAKNEA